MRGKSILSAYKKEDNEEKEKDLYKFVQKRGMMERRERL